MPAAFTGPKTPRAVPLGPPVTRPMMPRIVAATCGVITCLNISGGRSNSILGFIKRPSLFPIAVAAGIPKLRFFASPQGFNWRVVGADPEQLRGNFQPLSAKLNAHLREILIAGNFVSGVDADASVHFACAAVVKDHIRAGRRVIAAAATGKLRVLLTSEKGRGHRHSFES